VLASIRTLDRLKLLGKTLRAALNELAAIAPGWLLPAMSRHAGRAATRKRRAMDRRMVGS
jgi:hypothetical protein